MQANQSVVATFRGNAPGTYSLTTATVGNGGGTVTPNPTGNSCGTSCYTYASGTVVAVSATPTTGSAFGGWAGCSGTGPSCSVTMSGNQSATATISLQTFNLTISYAGTGTGAVSPNPLGTSCGTDCYTYPWGSVVALGATSATGSAFAGWSGAGCSGSGSCSVTVKAATAVASTFNLIPPVIRAQPASQIVTAPQTATFSVAAIGLGLFGYQWYRNGTAIGGATSANYTTAPTTSADNGAIFAVTVTNNTGTITSIPASLTVSVSGQVAGCTETNTPGFPSCFTVSSPTSIKAVQPASAASAKLKGTEDAAAGWATSKPPLRSNPRRLQHY